MLISEYNFPKPPLLMEMANVLDIDFKDLFISTKEKDMSDHTTVLKEIKRITDQALNK